MISFTPHLSLDDLRATLTWTRELTACVHVRQADSLCEQHSSLWDRVGFDSGPVHDPVSPSCSLSRARACARTRERGRPTDRASLLFFWAGTKVGCFSFVLLDVACVCLFALFSLGSLRPSKGTPPSSLSLSLSLICTRVRMTALVDNSPSKVPPLAVRDEIGFWLTGSRES